MLTTRTIFRYMHLLVLLVSVTACSKGSCKLGMWEGPASEEKVDQLSPRLQRIMHRYEDRAEHYRHQADVSEIHLERQRIAHQRQEAHVATEKRRITRQLLHLNLPARDIAAITGLTTHEVEEVRRSAWCFLL